MTKLDGLQDTVNALKAMGKLPNDDIKDMLKLQGNKIIMDAKSRTTSDRIRQSIGFINSKDAQYPHSVLVGVRWDKQGIKGRKDAIYVRTNKSKKTYRFIVRESITFWKLAMVHEYGSFQRKTNDGYNRGVMAAKPYLRPAFDANESSIIKDIKTILTDIIEQQAKKNNLK